MGSKSAKQWRPELCQVGAEPDRYEIWRALRDMWCLANGTESRPATYSAFAEYLGVPRQHEHGWSSEKSDRGMVAWFRIHGVMHDLGLVLVLSPDGWTLERRGG